MRVYQVSAVRGAVALADHDVGVDLWLALADGHVSIIMKGRDEFEAFAAMKKIGVATADIRSAGRSTLLAGPGSVFAPAEANDGQ